jgi:hypothetical protein
MTAAAAPVAAEPAADNPTVSAPAAVVAVPSASTVQAATTPPAVNLNFVGDQHRLTRLATMAYTRPSANHVAELYIAFGGLLALIAVLCCLRSVNVAGRLLSAVAALRRAMSR